MHNEHKTEIRSSERKGLLFSTRRPAHPFHNDSHTVKENLQYSYRLPILVPKMQITDLLIFEYKRMNGEHAARINATVATRHPLAS
jgi:hypothetical protein